MKIHTIAILTMLCLCACRPRPQTSETASVDLGAVSPDVAESVLIELAKVTGLANGGIVDLNHPTIVLLKEIIEKPKMQTNRWLAAASMAHLLTSKGVDHADNMIKALTALTFVRDQTSPSGPSKLYCADYYQCTFFLASLGEIANLNPNAALPIIGDFLKDVSGQVYEPSFARRRFLGIQAEGLIALIQIKSATNWTTLTATGEEPAVGDAQAFAEGYLHLEQIIKSIATFENNFNGKGVDLEHLTVSQRQVVESTPNPQIRKLLFEATANVLRTQAESTRDSFVFTPSDSEAMLAFAEFFYLNFHAIKMELVAFRDYRSRFSMSTAAWLNDLRQQLKSDTNLSRESVASTLVFMANRECQASSGSFYYAEAGRFLKQFASQETNQQFAILCGQARTRINEDLQKFELTPLSEDMEYKIYLAQEDGRRRGNPSPVFGRPFKSLAFHIREVNTKFLEFSLQALAASKQLSQQSGSPTKSNDKAMQDLQVLATESYAYSLWLRCLAFDARVGRAELNPGEHFLEMEQAVSEAFLNLKSRTSLDEICFYDSDNSQYYRRRQARDLSNLAQRIAAYFAARAGFAKSRSLLANGILQSGLMLTSLLSLLDAGLFSHHFVNIISSTTSKAAALQATAKLGTREALATAQVVSRWYSASSVKNGIRSLARQFVNSFVGSWAFTQYITVNMEVMKAVSNGRFDFSKLLVLPVSNQVLHGTAIFFMLPHFNWLFVQKLSAGLSPLLIEAGMLSEMSLAKLEQGVGIIHDTALFSSMPYVEQSIKSAIGSRPEAAHLQQEGWALGNGVSHSYLAAVLFRGQGFYAAFLARNTASEIPMANIEAALRSTPVLNEGGAP